MQSARSPASVCSPSPGAGRRGSPRCRASSPLPGSMPARPQKLGEKLSHSLGLRAALDRATAGQCRGAKTHPSAVRVPTVARQDQAFLGGGTDPVAHQSHVHLRWPGPTSREPAPALGREIGQRKGRAPSTSHAPVRRSPTPYKNPARQSPPTARAAAALMRVITARPLRPGSR